MFRLICLFIIIIFWMQSFIHSMIADKMADGHHHHHHRLLTTSQIYLVVVVIFTPYECWKKIQWTHLAWYFSNQPDRSSSSSLIYYCLHSLFLVQKSLNFITNHSGSSSKKILDQYLRQTPCSKELVTNYFIHLSFIFIFSKFFFWFRI